MKKRGLAILLTVVLLAAVLAVAAAAQTGSVVYVSGAYTGTDSDGTAQKPYTTIEAAYAALPDAGGTVVVCGNTTVTYSSEKSAWPSKTGPVTITSNDGTKNYRDEATLTFHNTRGARVFVQFSSATTFENIHMDDTNSKGTGQNVAVEFWAGPSLTFGQGVINTIDGGTELTNDYSNGRWVVRMGSYSSKIDSTFTMHSGTLSYIQGGNNQQDVGTSTVYVGKDAVIVDKIQCGATQKSVDTANITIEGAKVNELYLNGYGKSGTEAVMGSVTVTATGATISKVADQRSDGTAGSITGTAAASFTNCTIGDMTFTTIGINKLDLTLDNSVPTSLTKGSNVASASLTTLNGDYSKLDTTGWSTGTAGGEEPVGTLTEVYLDDTAADGGKGTKDSPVNTMEKAFAALKSGEAGTVCIIGEYNISVGAGTYVFPKHDAKVTICGVGTDAKIHFDKTGKTLVQFVTPVELKNLNWEYLHDGGNMDIYAGQELVVGDGVSFTCTSHGMGNNCIAIRGGYQKASYNISENNDTKITVLDGKLSYVMGGNGAADVGNATIRFGGKAEVVARLQVSGVNGLDVGTANVEITGGKIEDLVVVGHGGSAAINGDANITITGGSIANVITDRTGTAIITGDLTMTIGGTARISKINLSADMLTEQTLDKTQKLVFQDCTDVQVGAGFGDGWDSITFEDGTVVKMSGAYQAGASTALNMEDGSILYLNANANSELPAYNTIGTAKTGKVVLQAMHNITHVDAAAPGELVGGYQEHYRCTVCDKYFTDADGLQETTLEALTIPATGKVTYHDGYTEGSNYAMKKLMDIKGGKQGSAISGDTLLVSNNQGYCNMYDLKSGSLIAEFELASYNAGTKPSDKSGNGTSGGNWTNHANQMMFGAAKFDESDPLPLLYVTTGNSGNYDGNGAYIAKCSIERILYSEKKGWYAECVQIIEYNDSANVKADEVNGTTYKNMYKDGKFTYLDSDDWKNTQGYERIGWGWPASFVDSSPTQETAGKFYLYSARFRTTLAYEEINRGIYGNNDEAWDYYDDGVQAYIITEFDLPALPQSASDENYGGTVTLTPKDITNQFSTEYEIGVTQGGTMYQGRIYYSYGWCGSAENIYTRNGIQVFDIAQEKIVAKLPLYTHSTWNYEPECPSVWNGELVLGLNGNGGHSFYVLDHVALDAQTVDAACTSDGYSHIDCSLCGYELSRTVDTGSELGHKMTETKAAAPDCTTDGTNAYYTCSRCGKVYKDAAGNTETTVEAEKLPMLGHKLTKVEAKAATADAEGNIEYYVCQLCGKLYTDETAAKEITLADTVIAKLGSSGSPSTGEAFPAGAALCVMLLSGLALCAVLADKKRRA